MSKKRSSARQVKQKGHWRVAYYYTKTHSTLPREWIPVPGSNNMRMRTYAEAMAHAMAYNHAHSPPASYRAVVYPNRDRPKSIVEWSIYEEER